MDFDFGSGDLQIIVNGDDYHGVVTGNMPPGKHKKLVPREVRKCKNAASEK